jgi:hypothetical protein
MHPIKTPSSNFTYLGDGADVVDLHCRRERLEVAASFDGAVAIHSVWTFSDEERERIAQGANIQMSILGEPIPPAWLEVTDEQEVE